MSSLTTEILHVRASSGRVRPLAHNDLSQVRELWTAVLGDNAAGSATVARRFFSDSPWRDAPLGYKDDDGRLLACLAVSARPMVFRDRAIRAVVGHHLLTEPTRAGLRAGVEIVRHFLAGPQDLSLAAWNDFGRRLWLSAGGSVTPFHSLSWTRALMPAQYMLRILKHRGFPASAAIALYPACEALDAAIRVFRKRRITSTIALSDDLDAVTMMSYLSAFASDRALRPCYDVATLRWLLTTLDEQPNGRGPLQKVAVRTFSGRPLGWYVYYLSPSGAAEVMQVGGKDEWMDVVIDHMFDHARQRGAIAVSGPMDARLVGALSESHCAFHRPRKTWSLFHANDPRIAEAIHSGDVFLSRLEGAPWAEFEA